jgi:hypothetical protein
LECGSDRRFSGFSCWVRIIQVELLADYSTLYSSLMIVTDSDEIHQLSPESTVQKAAEIQTIFPDPFDDYNFPEPTEAECAQIDAISDKYFNRDIGTDKISPLRQDVGSEKPRIGIEIEDATLLVKAAGTEDQTQLSEPAWMKHLSPFSSFRKSKTLSVSDLTSPAW